MIGLGEGDAVSRAVNAGATAVVVGRSIMLRRSSESASNSSTHIIEVEGLTWRMLPL